MSLEEEFNENIELRVLLLALYKKEESESFKDVLFVMENTGVFRKKDGKKFLKQLKKLHYLTEEGFTLLGLQKAKEVEMEFKV